MNQFNPRKLALQVLEDVYDKNAYSNIALNKKLSKHEFSYQDKRFIRELVYGVIENRLLLDYQIREYSNIKLRKINNYLLCVLRMGAYQILCLDRIPNSAAVDESVKLTKKKYPQSTGFVNAILRNIARNENSIRLPDKEKNPIEHLSVLYSHPEWLVKRWIDRYGEEFATGLLKANNETPKLVVRPNLLKTDLEGLVKFLEGEGFTVEKAKLASNSLYITHMTQSAIELKEFKQGLFSIQDEAASLAVEVLSPTKGQRVLDMCSAPGGKTLYMAEIMKNSGAIIARDLHPHKIQMMETAVSKYGIKNVKLEVYDGLKYDKNSVEKFDKILLDAPCSGFGIIRRKPEIKFNKTKEDIVSLSNLQFELFKNAISYLKIGGEIVYSTCTIEPEENSQVVEKIKALFGDKIEIIDLGGESSPYIQLYPNVNGSDGFFISKIRRVG